MNRSDLGRRLFWPAAIAGTEAVYVWSFLRPYGLLDHYATPSLDLGKLGGYSMEAGRGFLAAMALLFVFYAVAYRRSSSPGAAPLAWIVGGGLLFAVTAAAVYPIGAADVFDNIFYGRMAAHYGANPLLTAPNAYPKDPLYFHVAWYWWPIPYGPLWAGVDALLSKLTSGDLLAGLLAFKALNVALYLACAGLLAGLLRRLRPGYVAAGLLLFAWNPLVILEGMASVHNDLALMALVLAAVLLLARGNALWGMAALLASVLVKFVSLPLIPVFLIAGWRGTASRCRFVLGAAALLLAAAAALYVPYMAEGDTLESLALRPFRQADLFTTSIPALISFVMEKHWEQPAVQSLVRRAAMGGWALYVAWETWRLWRRRPGETGRSPAGAFAAAGYRILLYFLLFACLWFQPWYLVWLLALAPLLGPGADAGILIVFSALVQVKYFIFDFAWAWETRMVDILAPEAATTVLIFGPMLALLAWRVWQVRRAARQEVPGTWKEVR